MDDIRNSIMVYNENRRAIRRLYDLRGAGTLESAQPPNPIWWSAPAWCCRWKNTPSLSTTTWRAAEQEERPRKDNCRIVVTGLFCEQPPLNLIKSLELAGCYVVNDDLMLVTPLADRRRDANRRSGAQSGRCLPASIGKYCR